MTGVATREPVFVKDLINREIPVVVSFGLPSARTLRQIVAQNPIDGRLLGDWIKEFHANDIKRMMEEISRGLTLGQGTQEIARRIFGIRGAAGARKTTRREAEAIARTASNAVANVARQAFFKENAKFIPEEIWVATLDSRTCPQCGALDGQRFKVNEGPIPPAHLNCRCVRVPAVFDEVLGNRPFKRSSFFAL